MNATLMLMLAGIGQPDFTLVRPVPAATTQAAGSSPRFSLFREPTGPESVPSPPVTYYLWGDGYYRTAPQPRTARTICVNGTCYQVRE